jgi:hypothetical protein
MGGCALLTGANELEIEKSTNGSNPPQGSGTGVGGGTSSGNPPSSSGSIPGFDGGGLPFPFGDGGSSGSSGSTLDGGLFPDGAKPDPRAGVSCGNSTCAPGIHCCLTSLAVYQCAATCNGSFGDLTCDDAYDCPGKVCCGEYAGTLVGSAKCVTSCNGADSLTMCSSDQDCVLPKKCLALDTPVPGGAKYRACDTRD